jgi:hypothetical protein
MNPIQESKQELEASIRYAENAIASAKQTIESIAKSQEQTGREQALEAEVTKLKSELDKLRKEKEASSGPCGCQAYRDLEERVDFYDKELKEMVQGAYTPTMPVIPKAVAIAIFREGLAHGAEAVATEIDNACDICIEESDYVGNFEVSFTKDIDLSDHLDTDWLRGRADEIGETFVLDCLANLCADNKFECRIHGVDDQEEKKND